MPPRVSPPAPLPAAGAPRAAPGEPVVVVDVVDGDTFDTANGRTVRVLGIDSCESGTDGGTLAEIDARSMLLSGGTVTLTREPGVTTDRYGRDLRYVQVNGQDFGAAMVVKDHTAVYAGRNDANPAYVADLLAADPNGRTLHSARAGSGLRPAGSRPES